MKYHRVKCCSVRVVENSIIRDITNEKTFLPVQCGSRMNHAEDGGQVTPDESHRKERDPEVVQVYIY